MGCIWSSESSQLRPLLESALGFEYQVEVHKLVDGVLNSG